MSSAYRSLTVKPHHSNDKKKQRPVIYRAFVFYLGGFLCRFIGFAEMFLS